MNGFDILRQKRQIVAQTEFIPANELFANLPISYAPLWTPSVDFPTRWVDFVDAPPPIQNMPGVATVYREPKGQGVQVTQVKLKAPRNC